MDPLESCTVSILFELGKLFRLHNDTFPSFYGVSLNEKHPFSLANYLMMTCNVLQSLLVDCGMAYYRGKSVIIKATKFKQFLQYQGLTGHYFDQMEVSGITKPGKQEWWLQLGKKETPKKWKPFNPSKQFKLLKRPPQHKPRLWRIISTNVCNLMFQIQYYVNEDNNSSRRNYNRRDEELRELEVLRDAHARNVQRILVETQEALAKALQKSGPSGTSAIIDSLSYTLKTIEFQQQQERMKLIVAQQQLQDGNNLSDKAADNNESTTNQDEDIVVGVTPNKKRYPLLTQLNIPLTKNYVSTLFREIVLLQSDHPTVIGELEYSTFRGTTCSILKVPRSSSFDTFKRNANE